MIELIQISERTFSRHAKTSEQIWTLQNNHNLLLAKLAAHCTTNDALYLLRFYLTERKQDLNINDSWSEWKFVKNVPSTFRVNLQNKLGLLTRWFRKNFLPLAFRWIRKVTPLETMTLYKAFILPHLEYAASPLRMDWKAYQAAKLESTNAFVLRVLLNVPRSTSYEELLWNNGALN